jgi:hypothetical protein
MKCPGSGFIDSGLRHDLEGQTLKIRCVECWQEVDEVPIPPIPRTDIYKDGRTVMVVSKRVVDHEMGNAWALRWRKEGPSWLLFASFVMTAVFTISGLISIVLNAIR